LDPFAPLRTGLDKVLSDVPVRTGTLSALVFASEDTGVVGRVEAEYRFLPELAGFGFAQVSSKLGWSAGAGVKLSF